MKIAYAFRRSFDYVTGLLAELEYLARPKSSCPQTSVGPSRRRAHIRGTPFLPNWNLKRLRYVLIH